MIVWRPDSTLVIVALALGLTGCADRLPDQDLRILQASPVAKLSTDILWKEYQADARAADGRYWGRAVEVSGKISSIVQGPPPRLMFLLERDSKNGVEARLLDTANHHRVQLNAGERITLRCFCEGLQGNVVLKSCIRP